LKPEWWDAPLVQEKYQGKEICDKMMITMMITDNLYAAPNTIRVMKLSGMRWAGHVELMAIHTVF
jgi:hypothetical protein